MARIEKNGSLSGAIGNVVFVKDGDRTYARSKPVGIKQTTQTKAAAKTFGQVSHREKVLRQHLLAALGFPSLQYFAARHRARLRRTVGTAKANADSSVPFFGQPEALPGFDFNPKLPWSQATNFFPNLTEDPAGSLVVELAELAWGTQIIPAKGATAARLSLYAMAVDFNRKEPEMAELGKLTVEVARGSPAAVQRWTFPAAAAGHWLLVVGALSFETKQKIPAEAWAGTYLWAKGG